MKKSLGCIALAVIAVVLVAGLAQAAPAMVGTWKGTALKITSDSVCSYTPVSLTVNKQCGNLFSGTITIGGLTTSVKVAGRLIYNSSSATYAIDIDGINYASYKITQLYIAGTYAASAPPKLMIASMEFYNTDLTTLSITNMFDAFNLVKQ